MVYSLMKGKRVIFMHKFEILVIKGCLKKWFHVHVYPTFLF